jgi:predicted lipoprotein with Yx(FWY)xxD motif
MFLKRSFVIALSFFMALFIAACGSHTTTGGGSYGGSNINPTATTPPMTGGNRSPAVIQTATTTVKGQSETVLTDAQGKTLYYFTADSATQSACSGNCAQMWPPLLFLGSGGLTSSTSLAGKLSVQIDANACQVEYNGHPLYVFSGDTAPGQTNSEGLFGMWFVATPSLAVQGGGSTNGGYGQQNSSSCSDYLNRPFSTHAIFARS